MNHVFVHGEDGAAALCHFANQSQAQYRFTIEHEAGSVPILLRGQHAHTPFEVDLLGGITLHTWQSAGIASYSGISQERYLTCWAMLALLQWRTLMLNPLMRPEDFLHEQPSNCLYAHRLFMEDYALAFELPKVCNACLHFYAELCPKDEVAAVKQYLLETAQSAGKPQLLGA